MVRRGAGKKGVTFIELLVAVAVLGFVLTALVRFFMEMMVFNTLSRDTTLAVSHAEYILEDIRSSSGVLTTQIDNHEWDWSTDEAFTSRGLMRIKNEVIDVSYDATQTPPPITVSVTWDTDNGRQTAITFLTLDSGV